MDKILPFPHQEKMRRVASNQFQQEKLVYNQKDKIVRKEEEEIKLENLINLYLIMKELKHSIV